MAHLGVSGVHTLAATRHTAVVAGVRRLGDGRQLNGPPKGLETLEICLKTLQNASEMPSKLVSSLNVHSCPCMFMDFMHFH